MDKQEPVANVEQKIGLSGKPKELVITHYRITVFILFTLFTLFVYCINHLPQPITNKDENAIVPLISVGSNAIDLPSEGQIQVGTLNMDGGHNSAHNLYSS